MLLQVGVKILLKNSEGKFLLARRNPKKYPEVGAEWDIIGGRIEPGSSLQENLIREINEEVGLNYQGNPRLVAAQDIIRENERHVVRLTYLGEIEGQPQIDEEHLEAKWFTAEELKQEIQIDRFFKQLLQDGSIIL